MIGLDTNVLIRYLTQDDPAQSRRANELVEGALDREDRCAIAIMVLCEMVWVLRDAYRLDRATIGSALERVLDTTEFVVEERDIARRALSDYRGGPGDYADYVIGWRNRQAGCERTATFDRGLRGSELFQVL